MERQGTFNVEYCPTGGMLADVMTKGLARERHARLLGLMGMRDVTIATNTAQSSSENGRLIRQKDLQDEGHSAGTTSGSVELRGIHAGNVARKLTAGK